MYISTWNIYNKLKRAIHVTGDNEHIRSNMYVEPDTIEVSTFIPLYPQLLRDVSGEVTYDTIWFITH